MYKLSDKFLLLWHYRSDHQQTGSSLEAKLNRQMSRAGGRQAAQNGIFLNKLLNEILQAVLEIQSKVVKRLE